MQWMLRWSDAQTVWKFYLKKTQEVIDKYKPHYILKTDANNEAFDYPKFGGIVINVKGDVVFKQIEYSQETISEATKKFPLLDIDKGDIRQLPYSNDKFDMILDLSTIDHIRTQEVPTVLNEYIRVVKENGLLFLVVWCAKKRKDVSTTEEWKPNAQYLFWYDDLKEALSQFLILEERDIIEGNLGILKYILLRINKNPNILSKNRNNLEETLKK